VPLGRARLCKAQRKHYLVTCGEESDLWFKLWNT